MGCQTLRKIDTSVQGTAGRGHGNQKQRQSEMLTRDVTR